MKYILFGGIAVKVQSLNSQPACRGNAGDHLENFVDENNSVLELIPQLLLFLQYV